MKVIFLDIDGVLNCKRTSNARKLPYIDDKRLLLRFRRLLEQTSAKVVCPPPGDTIQPACSVPSTGVFRLLT